MSIFINFLVLCVTFELAYADGSLLEKGERQVSSSEGEGLKKGGVEAPSANTGIANTSDSKPQEIKPYVASFDVFGSSRINASILKHHFGTEIDQWFKLGLSADDLVMALEKKLAKAIKEKYDLGFAEWSIVSHVEPAAIAVYITLDAVEKKEMSHRMSFMDAPKGKPADPDGLIALWKEYQKTAISLVEVGELQLDSVDCEALHCPFGHKHPKLQKYEKIFLEGVKKNFEKVERVLIEDAQAENRAAAAFLLAYATDGQAVAQKLTPRIKDSDDLVRNNVMRVLGDIAEYHPDVLIPAKPFAEALDFPRVSDRSKAINVIYFLTMGSAQARQYLMDNSLGSLVAIISSTQPDSRLAAHAILRKLSGKNYAANDAQSWLNWSKRVTGTSGRAVSEAR